MSLRCIGSLAKAELMFNRALTIDEGILGTSNLTVARDLNNLGDLLLVEGRFTEAEFLFRRALGIAEQIQGPCRRMWRQSLAIWPTFFKLRAITF